MDPEKSLPGDLWDVLSPKLTPSRKEKMIRVASRRTRHLALVVQDIHQPHNVSACLRSAEAFGIQNVHVVEMDNRFKPSTVARGVAGWLSIHRHPSPEACAKALRTQGYEIAAGMPASNSAPLEELSIRKPLAVLFGNEHTGLSPEWKPWVSSWFTIPMQGIVESLNISVSAAICMHNLSRKAIKLLPPDQYFLPPDIQRKLLGQWLSRQIRSWEDEYKHIKRKQSPRLAPN